ncbi:MAG TPA: di-heme oxidoredictase family protein [Gemmatimonadales bacterium]|nr:di-heme oxidoredictase family protein [Gemmatimonadales bacterium]
MQTLFSRSTCCALTSIAVLWLAACETSRDVVVNPPAPDSVIAGLLEASVATTLGAPFASLTADELARFTTGQQEFEAVETVAEGLGPVFNEASCASCHAMPVGGTNGRKETRFGTTTNGVFDPMTALGGSLIQDHSIGPPFSPEVVPATATITAHRITTPLFGLGLVDAVPDGELLALARLEAISSPRTAGTPNLVSEILTGRTRVGRFGWKAQVPTLFQFSGDAYVNEMGITNPEFPDENCPQGDCQLLAQNPAPGLNDDGTGVREFTDFMTMLAPPPRGAVTSQVVAGGTIFVAIGCANCHTPALATGPSPIAALSRKAFRPFSDFLLHDMGSLGDGIVQGTSTERQMRTAPLWGIASRPALLHDGRATTIDAAIRAHDGQGGNARDRFAGLSPQARTALLAYVNSL